MGFQTALVLLLKECFEGIPPGQSGTWFVEGKEGIFDALDSVSSEQASAKPSEKCASIAAHANHILFAMTGAADHIRGNKPSSDWESSWRVQSVSPEEWDRMKASIRSEYEVVLGWMETNETWNKQDSITGALSVLPHMAFHLGAIRQLMKL